MNSQELRNKLKAKIWTVHDHDTDVQKNILNDVIEVFDEWLSGIVNKNTDRRLGTTDFNGIAEDILMRDLKEKNGKR